MHPGGWRRRCYSEFPTCNCIFVSATALILLSSAIWCKVYVDDMFKWFIQNGATSHECTTSQETSRSTARRDSRCVETFCRRVNTKDIELRAPCLAEGWLEDEDWDEGECYDPDEVIDMFYEGDDIDNRRRDGDDDDDDCYCRCSSLSTDATSFDEDSYCPCNCNNRNAR